MVRFSISHKDSQEVIDELISGRINLGFVGAQYPCKNLEYIDFYEDILLLIASPEKDFPSESLNIKSLAGEDIVLREEGSGTRLLIEKALREKNMEINMFRSQAINESLEAIKKMVELDIGISFVSQIAVKSEVASGRLRQYKIDGLDLKRHFSLVYCKNRCLSPVEERFKDFVSNWKWENIDI